VQRGERAAVLAKGLVEVHEAPRVALGGTATVVARHARGHHEIDAAHAREARRPRAPQRRRA